MSGKDKEDYPEGIGPHDHTEEHTDLYKKSMHRY